ncbi:MAG: threonine--tRNA ligase [Patescibacteria group bacterium]
MNDEQLYKNRHSLSHIMTMAVLEIYPDAGLGVGPVIEDGFYQDYDLHEQISDETLPKIEKRMREIIKSNISFIPHDVDPQVAIEQYKSDPYKTELIEDLVKAGEKTVIFYKSDWFENLCEGPHVATSSEIDLESFKLTKIAGAYWRGNEKNKMLSRIYGIAFEDKAKLDAHLKMLEEAEKRDHRKIGQELDLYATSDLVGAGLPLFTPKGTVLRKVLEDLIWKIMKPYGYDRVTIPHIAKSDLYKVSGHWDKFADDIFHVKSQKTEQEFVLKPMNCPHHTQIYASRQRSYRDLPIRYSEVTAVYRDENTGQLAGLSRVRSITQDDAHVFCTIDQVKQEAKNLYDIVQKFYAAFDMPLKVWLSKRDPNNPEKYLGSDEVWEKSEGILKELLDEIGLEYKAVEGEAAFYGPKIDFMAQDAIGREWQLATIQLDFNLPERFELEYIDSDGEKKRPVMLHRAILGAVERFLAVIIEHYAGAFPFWLAPVQIKVVAVSKDYIEYAHSIAKELEAVDIRVEVDDSDEKVGKKIRDAAMMKIPWTIVVGEKEVNGGDFKINVFGQEENLIIKKEELVQKAIQIGQLPV